MLSNSKTVKDNGPLECVCILCTNIHEARVAVDDLPVGFIADPDAANKIVGAAELLGEAHASIHQAHNSIMHGADVGHRGDVQVGLQSTVVADSTLSRRLSLKENVTGPAPKYTLQVTNPENTAPGGSSADSKAKPELQHFLATLRGRAAELGILRDQPATTEIKQPSKFIVCDHCRSHGLRCNEASVCTECILRLIPCTHRPCEMSPASRERCPRQVCFYVHQDWMPNTYGQHDPHDQNWIILPGKLRDIRSGGAVGRLPPKSEAEITACYNSVSTRQQEAVRQMTACVNAGVATWENVAMDCACLGIERQNNAIRAEQAVRRP